MKKCVVILGAGASVDYGYPLWSELKQQIIDFDFDSFFEKTTITDQSTQSEYQKVHEEFLTILNNNDDYTLDHIIFKIDEPKIKHFQPTGYRIINMVGYLLALVEIEKKDDKWVSDFQNLLIKYIFDNHIDQGCEVNLLENLSIISLNYDRSFEYYLRNSFFEKLIGSATYRSHGGMPYSALLSRRNNITMFHPHGYMCSLPHRAVDKDGFAKAGAQEDITINHNNIRGIRDLGGIIAIPYGDKQLFHNDTIKRMGRQMYVVNEVQESDYNVANASIAKAEVVFCLGLSPAGINQSSLKFRDNQIVYLSNARSDISDIKPKGDRPNFISLDDNKRLDAKDFTEKFKELAF